MQNIKTESGLDTTLSFFILLRAAMRRGVSSICGSLLTNRILLTPRWLISLLCQPYTDTNKKTTAKISGRFAPASIELLNLWNDFRKVVQFIDDNQTWLRPLMDRVAANKKAEEK